jgi:hypothetical protein
MRNYRRRGMSCIRILENEGPTASELIFTVVGFVVLVNIELMGGYFGFDLYLCFYSYSYSYPSLYLLAFCLYPRACTSFNSPLRSLPPHPEQWFLVSRFAVASSSDRETCRRRFQGCHAVAFAPRELRPWVLSAWGSPMVNALPNRTTSLKVRPFEIGLPPARNTGFYSDLLLMRVLKAFDSGPAFQRTSFWSHFPGETVEQFNTGRPLILCTAHRFCVSC